MHSYRILSEAQTKQVSGGHLIGYLIILELPHIFMGFREFYNYVADLYHNGCQNIEPNDYFTQLFCNKQEICKE